MTDKKNEILKRYYQGKTTLEEERLLKAAFRKGEFSQELVLAYQNQVHELPTNLAEKIKNNIHQKKNRHLNYQWITIISTAAILVLIISLCSLLPNTSKPSMSLSDHLKKERFENALRVIGEVLEEKTPITQKILYEDNQLIIIIE